MTGRKRAACAEFDLNRLPADYETATKALIRLLQGPIGGQFGRSHTHQ